MAKSSRASRSMANTLLNALQRAEENWVKAVQLIEVMGEIRGDVELGPKSRNLAGQMHDIRKVVDTWTQE
jgi:hypothetical protein